MEQLYSFKDPCPEHKLVIDDVLRQHDQRIHGEGVTIEEKNKTCWKKTEKLQLAS